MFRALILLSLTCICKAGDYPTRYVVASPDVAVSQKCIQTLETALAAVDSNTGRHFQLVLIKGGNVEAQADSLFQEWGWGERYAKFRGKLHTSIMICFVSTETGAVTIRGTQDMLNLTAPKKLASAIEHFISGDVSEGKINLAATTTAVALVCATCPGYTPQSFLETKQIFQLKQIAIFMLLSSISTLLCLVVFRPSTPIAQGIRSFRHAPAIKA